MDGREAVSDHLISPATTPGSTNDEERGLTGAVLKNDKHIINRKWDTAVWNLAPCFMIIVSIIQILTFLLADDQTNKLLRVDPVQRQELWRYLSYMLLHWGKTHLALNVAIQCVLALPLEVEQGGLRTLVVYVGGGVFGALGACLLQPQPMVGASAGVYSLLISHLAHLYLNFNLVKYKKYRVFSVCVLAVSDICFYAFHSKTARHPPISLGAHTSGGLAGVLLGLIAYECYDNEAVMYKKYVKYFAFTAMVLLTIASIIAISVLPLSFFIR
ncbi:rhomboid-6 [Carabus blaptoides fortunei]